MSTSTMSLPSSDQTTHSNLSNANTTLTSIDEQGVDCSTATYVGGVTYSATHDTSTHDTSETNVKSGSPDRRTNSTTRSSILTTIGGVTLQELSSRTSKGPVHGRFIKY